MSTPRSQRIEALDVLRGFAVLGILVMNVQVFAMPLATYLNPTVWGDLDGLNGLVWVLGHLFADQKMMALFSMLFGAGILLFSERAASRGENEARWHFRRNFWLLLFGAAHAYLLWYGDILFVYALCAFVVFWLRRLAAWPLMILGLAFLTVSSLVYLSTGLFLPQMPEEVVDGIIQMGWSPAPAVLEAEVAAYRGGWWAQMQHRVPTAFEMHTFVLLIGTFWRAAGMMLIGMGLYRLGVISGVASARCYWQLLAFGGLVGLPLVAYGVYWNSANEWAVSSMFFGWQFNYWGSVAVSLGWMAVVMLVLYYARLPALTARLAAVGRMAFSNYIMQTLICGLVFYGHGLGLFGGVARSGQLALVFVIWSLQLWWSPLWLRHFRFGPLEWLWRALTYLRAQPMRVN